MRAFGKADRLASDEKARKPQSKWRDARRHGRQRLLSAGKLYFGTRATAIDCLIGDASLGGARVRVKAGTIVPHELFLIHLREWTAYEARVAWRRADGNIGLSFKRSFDLEGAFAPSLKDMREYC